MRQILLLLALISSSALAAELKPYLEGQLGFASLDDVDTKLSGAIGGGIATASAKIEYDHANRYYFLKLKNKDNGCYANAVIQSFLGLGNNFFKKIKILPNDYSVNDSAGKRP